MSHHGKHGRDHGHHKPHGGDVPSGDVVLWDRGRRIPALPTQDEPYAPWDPSRDGWSSVDWHEDDGEDA